MAMQSTWDRCLVFTWGWAAALTATYLAMTTPDTEPGMYLKYGKAPLSDQPQYRGNIGPYS